MGRWWVGGSVGGWWSGGFISWLKDIDVLSLTSRNRDSSPTRQFADTHFEDSSPTELKTVHRQILYCIYN